MKLDKIDATGQNKLLDERFLRDVALVNNQIHVAPPRGIGPINILSEGLIAAVTPNSGLKVTSCTKDTLHLEGRRTWSVVPGKILIYKGGDDLTFCEKCSPLFRRIVDVEQRGLFSTVVRTELIQLGDIVSRTFQDEASKKSEYEDTLAMSVMNSLIEPSFHCSHTGLGGKQRSLKDFGNFNESLPTFPEVCDPADPGASDWFQVDGTTGDCVYSNCCLGPSPMDPTQCLYCNSTCNNGCGSDNIKFDGNLIAFSFARACCNNDHCYKTQIYGRPRCDYEFYRQMREDCPAPIFGFIPSPFKLLCEKAALIAYVITLLTGEGLFAAQQALQIDHVNSNVCNQC